MFLRAADRRWIRFDRVIEAQVDKHFETVALRMLDQEELTVSWPEWLKAVGEHSCRLFPAEPGTFLLSMCDDSLHRERVIAWTLDGMSRVEPVTAGGVFFGREIPFTVQHPDGTVQDLCTDWDTGEDWLADMVADQHRVRESTSLEEGPPRWWLDRCSRPGS